MDVQWHFPTNCHLSVACSKGLSLVQWMFTATVQWMFSGVVQWMFIFVRSGVKYFDPGSPGYIYYVILLDIHIYIYIYIYNNI